LKDLSTKKSVPEPNGIIGVKAEFLVGLVVPASLEWLFSDAAKNVEASALMKGCPVAAVTLDLT